MCIENALQYNIFQNHILCEELQEAIPAQTSRSRKKSCVVMLCIPATEGRRSPFRIAAEKELGVIQKHAKAAGYALHVLHVSETVLGELDQLGSVDCFHLIAHGIPKNTAHGLGNGIVFTDKSGRIEVRDTKEFLEQVILRVNLNVCSFNLCYSKEHAEYVTQKLGVKFACVGEKVEVSAARIFGEQFYRYYFRASDPRLHSKRQKGL